MVPRVLFNAYLWFSLCFWLNVKTSLIHNPPAEPGVSPAIRLEVSGATSSRSQALVEVSTGFCFPAVDIQKKASSYPGTAGYQGISGLVKVAGDRLIDDIQMCRI